MTELGRVVPRTTLVIVRGLPGCGKTTFARGWVAEDPGTRARVNRDDLRAMMHASVFLGRRTEDQVVAAVNAMIGALLSSGVSVVSDDTNIPGRTVRILSDLAAGSGADVTCVDLTGVPVETCVERDARRDRPVGRRVIEDMAVALGRERSGTVW